MIESNAAFPSRMRQRAPLVYGVLAAVWLIVVIWQALEHRRITQGERTALINRSRDIATTLSVVIRSQRHFGGIISQERLESALNDLAKSGELLSVALLNATGDVVIAVGKPMDLPKSNTVPQNIRWDDQSVTLVNLIDLGASVTPEGETNRPTIVLPRREGSNAVHNAGRDFPWPGEPGPPPNRFTNGTVATVSSNMFDRPANPREGRPRFGRPFWMDEAEYHSLIATRGLHGLVISMNTSSLATAAVRDLWLRASICFFAGLSVLGLGLAWHTLGKSSELQMHLVRASELNSHLREMNVAAAGLAHETRNPLNIVRGLAQMISREPGASEEIKGKSRQITDEVDRVTGQLNEFINYSRPREVRRAPVALSAVVNDVVRALQGDIAEKSIQLKADDENLTVEADEQLLRQVLFNLVINSVQAVETGGVIEILSRKTATTEGKIEIRDNGPGVAVEHRDEIFKPYFTTRAQGTGLGLAIVSQIVLAHGWEIKYIPNGSAGAVFRLEHLKLSTKDGVKT